MVELFNLAVFASNQTRPVAYLVSLLYKI